MTILRIDSCLLLVRYWAFIAEGIVATTRYLRYPQPLDTHRRILQKMVKTPSAYVAIVLSDPVDDVSGPLCFGAAYDSTPFAGEEVEYDIPYLYHQPTHLAATACLRKDFDRFCRQKKVKRYFLTTTAFNGAAQQCFPRYGFKRSHVVYKRELA